MQIINSITETWIVGTFSCTITGFYIRSFYILLTTSGYFMTCWDWIRFDLLDFLCLHNWNAINADLSHFSRPRSVLHLRKPHTGQREIIVLAVHRQLFQQQQFLQCANAHALPGRNHVPLCEPIANGRLHLVRSGREAPVAQPEERHHRRRQGPRPRRAVQRGVADAHLWGHRPVRPGQLDLRNRHRGWQTGPEKVLQNDS